MSTSAQDLFAFTRDLPLRMRATVRSPGEVQIGVDSHHGVVLGGLTQTEVDWLLSLHRQPTARTAPTLPSARREELAALLAAHDLVRRNEALTESPNRLEPSRSAGQAKTVALLGRGHLVGVLRAQLHRCGIRVVSTNSAPGQAPAVTVILASPALGMHDAQEWARSHAVHLPVVIRPGYASIGPLINGVDGPCLHCLDLARTDRDPAWPTVLGSVAARSLGAGQPIQSPAEVSTAIAGLTAMVLQAHFAGLSVPQGVAWDVHPPSPEVTARRWERHPRCTMGH